MPAMSEPRRKRRGPITVFCEYRRFRLAVIVAFVVPALYVAGFGPVCWLTDHGVLPIACSYPVYRPLAIFVANWCPSWVESALTRYGELGGQPRAPMAWMIAFERQQMEWRRARERFYREIGNDITPND